MKVPTVLYHATSSEAWKAIKTEGLRPAFPAVYMTDDLKAALWFAARSESGVVLAIETKHLDKKLLGTAHEMLCDILKTTDFWHYYNSIPAKYVSKLQLRKKSL